MTIVYNPTHDWIGILNRKTLLIRVSNDKIYCVYCPKRWIEV